MSARDGSQTGTPGVRYVEKTVRKGSQVYKIPCIVAEVHTMPGRSCEQSKGSRSRVWSFNRYDYIEAVALGVAWRNWMVSQLQQPLLPGAVVSKPQTEW